jgi:hypothetical protein
MIDWYHMMGTNLLKDVSHNQRITPTHSQKKNLQEQLYQEISDSITRGFGKKTLGSFEKYLNKAISLLTIQTQKDPKQYVPHGATHSLSVMHLSRKTCQNISGSFQNKLIETIKLPFPVIQFISETIGLLHDIGYPSQAEKKLQKSNHTIEGALLFQQHISEDLKSALQDTGYGDRAAHICQLIEDEILYHSADKIESLFLYQNTHERLLTNTEPEADDHKKQLPTFGRFADQHSFKDNKLGIPCQLVNPHNPKDFFRWVIRKADNEDSAACRLTHYSGNTLSYAKLTVLHFISGYLKEKRASISVLERTRFPDKRFQTPEENDFYVFFKSMPQQRKYFLGLYITQKLLIQTKGQHAIAITPFIKDPLADIMVNDEKGKPVLLSQFFPKRIALAMEACTNGNEIMSVFINRDPKRLRSVSSSF